MSEWYKSSYSGGDNNCVEAAHLPADFHKSSYSVEQGACVEVAEALCVRVKWDTKNRELRALFFGSGEWQAFLGIAKGT